MVTHRPARTSTPMSEDRPNAIETRWRQRFHNLSKAYALLREAAEAPSLSRLEEEGLIQRFEYTFELCWKTMKDYLEAGGLDVRLPRDVLKEAYRTGLVSDGEAWLEVLEKRNLLAHTYDDERFAEALGRVRGRFFPAMRELVGRLEAEV